MQRFTGDRVIQTSSGAMPVTLGDRLPSMPGLGIDARDPLARGMTELVSGGWAKPRQLSLALGTPQRAREPDSRASASTALVMRS